MLLTRRKFYYYRYSNKNHTYFEDGMKLRVDNDWLGRRRFSLTSDERKVNTRILNKINEDINKLRRADEGSKDNTECNSM